MPLAAAILITYAETAAAPERRAWWRSWWRWSWWRRGHLGLSLVYTDTNAAHLVVDLVIADSRADQGVLMAVMLAIGLLINREAVLWCRDRQNPMGATLPCGEPERGV